MRQYINRMRRYLINRTLLLIFAFLGFTLFCTERLCAKEFVVVIDAGHGGHDPGAVGKISKEKNINLKAALKLGQLINNNCSDVKVVYTRKKDVFVALDKRAQIANDAKADLFISIHTNAVAKNRTVRGASTWTLGLARTQENLDVAKRENSVILFESDYKTRYAGFDPNSAESNIIFEYMQDKFMEQSVQMASLVQKEFKHRCKRVDRGVHQAGFLVLKASAMPSVLVELGFISTPEEERYLNTEAGINNLANGIYRAFLNYKNEHNRGLSTVGKSQANQAATKSVTNERKSTAQSATSATNVKNKTAEIEDNEPIIFKIQFLTASAPLRKGDKRFKGVTDYEYYKENGILKYTCSASQDYNSVLRKRRELASKFADAFIIAFQGDKKINVNKAIEAFKEKRKK